MPKQPNEPFQTIGSPSEAELDRQPKPTKGPTDELDHESVDGIPTAEPVQFAEAGVRVRRHRSWTGRFFAAAIGLVPIFLLGVTTQLTPNKNGLGTHHQLGLPPCSSRVILGIRCPACGMTTSWAHFVRGSWLTSVRTNVGGFLLAIYTFPLAFVCLQAARSGALPHDDVQRRLVLWILIIGGITLVDWVIRLGLEHYSASGF